MRNLLRCPGFVVGVVRVVGVVGLAAWAGCSSPPPDPCTLTACIDQVTVSLTPPAELPYTVQLTLDAQMLSFTCDSMGVRGASKPGILQSCTGAQFIIAGKPASVQIAVTTVGAVRNVAPIAPAYSPVTQPDPMCPMMTCQQAMLTVH